jgi:hypothetical protein
MNEELGDLQTNEMFILLPDFISPELGRSCATYHSTSIKYCFGVGALKSDCSSALCCGFSRQHKHQKVPYLGIRSSDTKNCFVDTLF